MHQMPRPEQQKQRTDCHQNSLIGNRDQGQQNHGRNVYGNPILAHKDEFTASGRFAAGRRRRNQTKEKTHKGVQTAMRQLRFLLQIFHHGLSRG